VGLKLVIQGQAEQLERAAILALVELIPYRSGWRAKVGGQMDLDGLASRFRQRRGDTSASARW